MKRVFLLVLLALIFPLSAQEGSPPPTFFENAVIVVGSTAAASDVIAATEMATYIATNTFTEKQIQLEPTIFPSEYKEVPPETMTIVRPDSLETLWYQDKNPFGDDDGVFDPWETHEEIRIYPYEEEERLLLLGTEQNRGIPSIMYVADNVRIPPKIWISQGNPKMLTERVIDLDYFGIQYFYLPDPGLTPPNFKLLDTVYTVIDAGYLWDYDATGKQFAETDEEYQAYVLTGNPKYYWSQRLMTGEETYYKAHQVVVKDVDIDHNKAYIQISDYNQGTLFEGIMVFDPEHGFSPNLQKQGWTGMNGTKIGRSQYDCIVIYNTVEYYDDQGHRHIQYFYPVFALDGIFTFLGTEKRGIQANIYELTDYFVLKDHYCCVPFSTDPYNFSLQIHFSTTKTPQTCFDVNAYVDEAVPSQYRDYDSEDYFNFCLHNLNAQDIMFEVVMGLCDTIEPPICAETFTFEGPQNYFLGTYEVKMEKPYFTVEFSTEVPYDFTVKQEIPGNTITIREPLPVEPTRIIMLDTELDFAGWKDACEYNLILIGGPVANIIVRLLVDEGISIVDWTTSPGEWEYITAPFGHCDILIIAGADRDATRYAVEQLIEG